MSEMHPDWCPGCGSLHEGLRGQIDQESQAQAWRKQNGRGRRETEPEQTIETAELWLSGFGADEE